MGVKKELGGAFHNNTPQH